MNAPIRASSGLVDELCIALAHRWEPERLFVIFTAYIDESNTHGPAPTLIMGAFLGHAYQWRIFNRDLDRIRKRYGFDIFHAADFIVSRGEFDGWDEEKSRRLVYDLTALVRDDLTEGATIHLERDRYLRDYRNTEFPPKMQPDSQFGLCFRGLFAHLIRVVAATGRHPVLHVVIEDGHKNVGSACVIFNEFKDRLRRNGVDLLGTVTIAEKAATKELMVADFLAHTHSMLRANDAVPGGANFEPPVVVPGARRSARLSFLEFTAAGFVEMKQQFVRDKIEKAIRKRKERDARRALSSVPSKAEQSS